MRILVTTSTYFPTIGGQELVVENLVRRLSERGNFVVLMMPLRSWLNHWITGKGSLKLIPAPPFQILIATSNSVLFQKVWQWYFQFFLFIFKIDVVSSHGFFPSGVLVAKGIVGQRCPHIACCHGADIQIDRASSYGMRLNNDIDLTVKKFIHQVDRLIAISASVRGEYLALEVAEESIASIPNGFGDERFALSENDQQRTLLRRKYKLALNDFIVLTVGRNHPKKNFQQVITIAKVLQDNEKNIVFVLCGSGVGELRDVPPNVVLLDPNLEGWIQDRIPSDEIVELYQAADVFLFPSFIETFGIVLLEAMSFALPVICSNATGCADVTKNGEFGLICDPVDSETFVNHITALHTSSELRSYWSEKARLRSTNFDWDVVVDQYVSEFKTLIKQGDD